MANRFRPTDQRAQSLVESAPGKTGGHEHAEPAVAAADATEIPPLPGIDIADGLRRVGGNARIYRNLLARFAESFADAGTRTEQLLIAGDVEAAGRIVHNLKGVAGNLGAARLHQSADAADAAMRHGSETDRTTALHALLPRLKEVIEGLRQFAPAPASSGQDGAVTAERIAALPEGLREEFKSALGRGDLDQMLSLVARIAAIDPPLAEGLGGLVNDFAHERLLALMSKASARP